MKTKFKKALLDCFLFKDVDSKNFCKNEGYFAFKEFSKGDKVFSENKELSIIVNGVADIYQGNVLLNSISASEAFGVTLPFSDEMLITEIIAHTNLIIATISYNNLMALFREFPQITTNYINFLSDRIVFLNKRIHIMTNNDLSSRLLDFLLNASKDGVVEIKEGYTKLASRLNITRPSLYRIFNELELEGVIKREGKMIFMLDLK